MWKILHNIAKCLEGKGSYKKSNTTLGHGFNKIAIRNKTQKMSGHRSLPKPTIVNK